MPLNCEKLTEYNWVTERTWWGYRWHFWTTRLSASRWTQRPQGRTCSQKSQTICRLVSECQKILEQIVAYELAIFWFQLIEKDYFGFLHLDKRDKIPTWLHADRRVTKQLSGNNYKCMFQVKLLVHWKLACCLETHNQGLLCVRCSCISRKQCWRHLGWGPLKGAESAHPSRVLDMRELLGGWQRILCPRRE